MDISVFRDAEGRQLWEQKTGQAAILIAFASIAEILGATGMLALVADLAVAVGLPIGVLGLADRFVKAMRKK